MWKYLTATIFVRFDQGRNDWSVTANGQQYDHIEDALDAYRVEEWELVNVVGDHQPQHGYERCRAFFKAPA